MTTRPLALALLALVGCDGDKTTPPVETGESGLVGSIDEDGDGYTADEDCDDHDPRTNPSKEELCDGVDNDCDEEVDEDVELTWYADADGDGFGDLGSSTESCERPDGYVPTATDCDDSSDQSWPGAPEICDGQDNDCDEVADDGATSTYYADADDDGYGDADVTTEACAAPDGYVAAKADLSDSDCDDADASSHPDGAERCDGADNDCDGDIDEGTGVEVTWYQDRDEDGYGDPDRATSACAAPDGYVADDTDCDDLETDTHPGADEICDEADNDCDGGVDEGATDGDTWFADADGDGFGDPTDSTTACDEPAGYSASDEDCDDTDADINPDAEEICDGVDQDCDGTADDGASDAADWYTDADGDSYGDPAASTAACDAPAGTVANDDDCDDTDDDNYPGAPEICDTEDNDCDGDIDEDGTDNAATWYEDRDEDGYGDPDRGEVSCEPPAGYVEEDSDCDDLDADVHPGATEICDGEDDDCDGTVDDDATDATDWYADADGDAHGDPSVSASACEAPDGYVGLDDDCDDADAAVYPGATETCDGVDEDCDGDTDEGASDADTWYTDADADGYGDPTASTSACEAPAGTVANDDDCDDDDASVSPDADEICDGIDDDCDGAVDEDSAVDADTWYADRDEDGHGDPARTDVACDAPAGYVAAGDDCDDLDDTVYPGATETCDGEDEDCDGSTDEGASDATDWYADADGDAHGDPSVSTSACEAPSGYVGLDDDCDDTDSGTHPGATETCDGVDEDCDGDTDEGASDASAWYADGDGDSYGDPGVSELSCAAPSGYVASDEDCDDGDPAVNPDADERCNAVDDDCDGVTDEDGAVDVVTWHQDRDEDGFGDPSRTDIDCDQPSGYVADATDCDDLDDTVHPGATESCNGDDDDCDGTTDEDDAVDASTWYADVDDDRYGDSAVSDLSCAAPSGYVSDDTDCDDSDATVNPGATETCDGEDDDCDGAVDEDSASDAGIWYADDDGDAFGDPTASDVSCEAPAGYVAVAEDCDDGDPAVNPDADERCNAIDDDCDGDTDEDGAVDVVTWYQDRDEDSYGDPSRTDIDCDQPSGYVADATDCDDLDDTVHPGAIESCNGDDDDCDGTTDEDDAVDAGTWYADVDDDRYGDSAVSELSCSAPSGYIADDTDCDDADATVNPGATETCDGEDDDCDGAVDEDSASDAGTWYADDDGDSYGDPAVSDVSCEAPSGYVASGADCDDADASVYPGATEICDGEDDDCDGETDEDGAVDVVTWYQDRDEDGYGDATRTDIDCDQPSGYVEDDTDCDDLVAAVNPGATETCNSIDDDCDGAVDDDAIDATTWYQDADSDRYGDASVSSVECSKPSGYVSNSTDCDDADSTAHPGATEYCDDVDDDCDGSIDENARNATDWYPDDDADGYGDATATPTTDCDAPTGTVDDDTDCDDTDSAIHPGASEYCDGTDDDCSGDEDGVVTFTRTTGSKTDYTSTFAAGTSTSPASVSITSSGTLMFCDGTYYTNLTMSGTSITVESLNGSGSTTLDGASKGRTFYTTSATVNVTGLTLQNGYTTANGANLYLYTSTSASLDDVVLLDGAALRGANLGCYQCTADLVDVDIEGGAATSQGGGIYNYQGTMTGDNVLVDDNTAPNGGAYYGGTGKLSLTDSYVSNNAATTYAGAFYLNNGSATLDSTDLEYNDGGNYGGAVYMNAATLTMTSSEIDNNTADLLGGGVYMNGASTMTCTGASGETSGVWGNMALAAGAVFIGSSSGTLTSNTCDWTATSDNTMYDIVTHLYLYFNYGNNVSFTCASGVCY